MSLKRGKAAGAKEVPEESRPRPVQAPSSEKPRAAEAAGTWGKPREGPATRPHASSSSSSGAAKAKAQAKTTVNIAALAARNLGGFVPDKIFVGGVPTSCTEEQFRSYFEVYGAIAKVELHALRGFGYITYESVESVDACLEKYAAHYLCKKWVEVKRSIPRELIDAYEREQRRLMAEHDIQQDSDRGASGHSGADVPVLSGAPKAAQPPPPTRAAPPSVHATGSWGGKGQGKGEPSGTLSRITQLKEMGFSEAVARRVLSECAWDVNKAIDHLLTVGPPACAVEAAEDFPVLAPGAGQASSAAAVSPHAWASRSPDLRGARGPEPHVPGLNSPSSPDSLESPAGAHLSRQAPCLPTSPERVNEPVPPSPSSKAGLPAAGMSRPAAAERENHTAFADHGVAGGDVVVAPSPKPEPATVTAEKPATAEPVAHKRLERVASPWPVDGGQQDASQLSVAVGDFVAVWVDTRTEHGWIHAELHRVGSGEVQVGWLPVFVFQELPEGRRWMRVTAEWTASDASQCGVSVGAVVVVWVKSKTPEGWAYIEATEGGSTRAGWTPVSCLEWNED